MSELSTPTLTDEHRARIRAIVTDVLELEPEELTETADFVGEYDADSLLAIEMFARIEGELSMTLAPEDLTDMTSLGDVYRVVGRRLEGSAKHDG